MLSKKKIAIFLATAIAGLAIWPGIAALTGEQEPWDSALFFLGGIPAMLLVSALAGFIEPERPWLWGIAVISLQTIALFSAGEFGPLALVGLFFFGILAVLCMGSAFVGASL